VLATHGGIFRQPSVLRKPSRWTSIASGPLRGAYPPRLQGITSRVAAGPARLQAGSVAPL